MKRIKFLNILTLIVSLLVGCNRDTYKMKPLQIPTNIHVTTKIKGANATNPNGDGSGEVTFTARAKNAITYKFILGDEKVFFPSGTYKHTFSKVGNHTYNATIIAKGEGGITISTQKQVRVLVNYTPPADLVKMLYGDSERVWRIKKETAGHLGVGPADKTAPSWWSATPNDKNGKGIYDDRITFKKDGNYSYETNNTGFGKKAAMDTDISSVAALGRDADNKDGDYENIELASFKGTWNLTAPKGKETLYMSGIGYLGMYVGGNHKYEIQKRSDNEMSVRTIGADGNAWYMILIAD